MAQPLHKRDERDRHQFSRLETAGSLQAADQDLPLRRSTPRHHEYPPLTKLSDQHWGDLWRSRRDHDGIVWRMYDPTLVAIPKAHPDSFVAVCPEPVLGLTRELGSNLDREHLPSALGQDCGLVA